MKKGQFVVLIVTILIIGIGIGTVIYLKSDSVENNKTKNNEQSEDINSKEIISNLKANILNSKVEVSQNDDNGFEGTNKKKVVITISKPEILSDITGWQLYGSCVMACKYGYEIGDNQYDEVNDSIEINTLSYTDTITYSDIKERTYIVRYYYEKDGVRTYSDWSNPYIVKLSNN